MLNIENHVYIYFIHTGQNQATVCHTLFLVMLPQVKIILKIW